jgi:hypothetical protein
MTTPVLPPVGPQWNIWARQVTTFLQRNLNRLQTLRASDNTSEDGIIMWDSVNGYPVVAKGGEWRQVVLADGEANLGASSSITAAAADTAYPITFTMVSGSGISLGTPASRIVFEEGGQYLLSFSAQINSSSSSTVDFYFWPRVNGTDITGSTMRNSLHNNGATLVVSRSSIFTFTAGDYLKRCGRQIARLARLKHSPLQRLPQPHLRLRFRSHG